MGRDRAAVVDATVVKLLLASAIIALGTSGFVIAVPYYVLDKLNRADAVGTVVAASTIGYIVTCLLSEHLARRISPRIIVTAAIAGVAVFLFLFQFTATVPVMFATLLVYGLCLGLVWAPLMGWLSGDAEGVTSVQAAGAVQHRLVHQHHHRPAGHQLHGQAQHRVAIHGDDGCAGSGKPDRPDGSIPAQRGTVQAGRTDDRIGSRDGVGADARGSTLPMPPKMQYIRFLAWTGALIGYMAVGLFRFQMPHLAKTIGMDEVVFGRVATALSLAITLAFFATARWIGWHGKTRWIFLPQAALIGVAALMTWTTDRVDHGGADDGHGLRSRTALRQQRLLWLAGRGPGRTDPADGDSRGLPQHRRDRGQLRRQPAQPAPGPQPRLSVPGGGHRA